MYNNVPIVGINVSGTASFTFSPVGSTVRLHPALFAWTGATINQIEPDPGIDGIAFVGYKVTNPSAGIWHYEYAIYNENLDRAIQSFAVPTGRGISKYRVSCAAQGTWMGKRWNRGKRGYSSTPWTSVERGALTWSWRRLRKTQNANAIRWGTLYNFRFDSDRPPQNEFAVIGFFRPECQSWFPFRARRRMNASPHDRPARDRHHRRDLITPFLLTGIAHGGLQENWRIK